MKGILLILISSLVFGLVADAENSLESLKKEARVLGLPDDPTWRKLLHFRAGRKKSDVVSDSFFLASEGRRDAAAELDATLDLYFGLESGVRSKSEFPARLLWLSERLELPNYSIEYVLKGDDRKIEAWREIESISLYLVSGYFGNPASTFGHSLLKLNTNSNRGGAELLDLTINYGALVPERENMIFYVVRGLSGMYQAGFSDRHYYTQDQVYTKTEFRDIWDYELNLTDYQRSLLVFHLWEIIGVKFDYYFLKENCAFRLAELMELVLDEDLIIERKPWYIPEEMFHRIQSLDNMRRRNGEEALIKEIRSIPSSRRELYAEYDRLDQREKDAVDEFIRQGSESDFEAVLSQFGEDRHGPIMDALLAYYQYRTTGKGDKASTDLLRSKDDALLKRLRLPAGGEDRLEVFVPDEPTRYGNPGYLEFGGSIDFDGDFSGRIRVSGFSKESFVPNSLESGELAALDATLRVRSGSVYLDRLDVIRVKKFNLLRDVIEGESRTSWAARLGMERIEFSDAIEKDWFFEWSAGRSYVLREGAFGYGMLEFSAHTGSLDYLVTPVVGIVAKGKRWGFAAEGGWSLGEDTDFGVWEFKAQRTLSRNQALRLEYGNKRATRLSVSLVQYW